MTEPRKEAGASPSVACRSTPVEGPLATPQAEGRSDAGTIPGDALLRAVAAPWLFVPTREQGA